MVENESSPGRRGRASSTGNAGEKLLRVLESAAGPGGPHRLGEIAVRAGVAKSTAHRLLAMLVAEGFLAGTGGRYGIGTRLRALAAEVAADAPAGIERILHELQDRVAGHTVHLAVRSGDRMVYTHKIDSVHAYQMASRLGMAIPLHCSAIGKAVLARLTADELETLLSTTELTARTEATITDRARLDAELAYVRARGFAVDEEENEATIRCIGAAVLDRDGRPVGGVSVTAVTFVVSRVELESFAPQVLAAADRLRPVLGPLHDR
jgi:IclR family acetate operon transcriptional repressor